MALSIILHFCLRTRADFEIMQRTSVKVNHSTARPSKVSLTLSWNDAGPSVSACILISRSCFAKLVPDGLAKRIQLYCLPKERCQTATIEVQGKWYRPCWLFNSECAERFLSEPTPAQLHSESYCTASTKVLLLCTLCTSSAMKSFSSLIKITSSNSLFVVIYSLSPLAEPASHPGGEQRECAKVANSGAWCERRH